MLLLSGPEVATEVYSQLKDRITALKLKSVIPGLAVVLVGNDPASNVYVRSKTKRFNALDLYSETFHLAADTPESELIVLIDRLNKDARFHGILVQLPLPDHLNEDRILAAINPEKDVDGFHPVNMGLLAQGRPAFIPCTPKGVMRILSYYKISLQGKHVVIIGRSNIVGRPLSILTSMKSTDKNATTTVCHSGTPDIPEISRMADILMVAVGRPEMVKQNYIKPGAVVIDVGINRVEDKKAKRGYRLTGDVDFASVRERASAITPVPGGVGPMTIAMLVENTVEAAEITI
ncbi:MAG: bifunctional 5,10-methylenetetrahydrofolate dehydrogenase/5,10-methenyltetrahydrofolate cyclohydrolase [Fidelibacterota bacterium]